MDIRLSSIFCNYKQPYNEDSRCIHLCRWLEYTVGQIPRWGMLNQGCIIQNIYGYGHITVFKKAPCKFVFQNYTFKALGL